MSVVLKAEKREELGSSATRRVRKAGRIPSVIYSKKGNINFSLDAKEFENEYLKGIAPTSIIEVELDGKKIRTIAHKIELDPVSDRPIHIDFFNCDEDKFIRAKSKFNFTNKDKSPGIKKGAFLHIVLRRAEVLCDNEAAIPHEIEADVGALHVGYKLRANDIKLPNGVKFANNANFLIASIVGRGKSDDEAPAAAAAAPAAAAPATAAAKAPAGKAADKK